MDMQLFGNKQNTIKTAFHNTTVLFEFFIHVGMGRNFSPKPSICLFFFFFFFAG